MNESDRKARTTDRRWAAKRVNNIYEMLDKVKKDDAFLFEKAAEALRAFSNVPSTSGDEAYSTLLAVMANCLTMRSSMEKSKTRLSKKA